MIRPRRVKKEKRDKKGCRYAGVLWGLPVVCLLLAVSSGVAATPAVIYKGPRPKQDLSAAQKQKGVAGELESGDALAHGYVYNPKGKTDPFKSFIALPESVSEKKRRKPKTYLETLDLSQLDLIAVIVGPKGNFAMVRDAKGIGYVIRKGTPIGVNGGVVQKITDKEVIIREGRRTVAKKLYKE